ncbi:hypothetical protein YPPY54_4605, partial [Yersinia pestis PY-54]
GIGLERAFLLKRAVINVSGAKYGYNSGRNNATQNHSLPTS